MAGAGRGWAEPVLAGGRRKEKGFERAHRGAACLQGSEAIKVLWMELTTESLLCHSQLPLAAQSLGTQLPGASASLGPGHLCVALLFSTPSVPPLW